LTSLAEEQPPLWPWQRWSLVAINVVIVIFGKIEVLVFTHHHSLIISSARQMLPKLQVSTNRWEEEEKSW
jgi:hypothetical protein